MRESESEGLVVAKPAHLLTAPSWGLVGSWWLWAGVGGPERAVVDVKSILRRRTKGINRRGDPSNWPLLLPSRGDDDLLDMSCQRLVEPGPRRSGSLPRRSGGGVPARPRSVPLRWSPPGSREAACRPPRQSPACSWLHGCSRIVEFGPSPARALRLFLVCQLENRRRGTETPPLRYAPALSRFVTRRRHTLTIPQ